MLDRLPRPDRIEARIGERPLAVGLDATQLEVGAARARATQRLLGDVDAEHVIVGVRDRGGQLPFAAADVEHAQRRGGRRSRFIERSRAALSSARELREQEGAAQLESAWLRPFGHGLPQLLKVAAAQVGRHLCTKLRDALILPACLGGARHEVVRLR